MSKPFLKDKKFLVVDDEHATIEIVKEVLNQNGAKASGITNPEQGFGMMAKEKYDAIILDRYMPGVDGHEILEQLKAHPQMKSIPVIMLTGESKSEEIKKSIQLGASGYVIKPFTPKSFLAQLQKILAK
jgi:DNA-binding response OmpR family regulator